MSNNISDRDVSDKLLSSAWRDFLANTQDFMFVKNTDLAYINCSAAFAGLVGLSSPDGVAGLTDFDIFKDRALAERYRGDDRKILESGEPLLNFIEPLPPKEDGTPRYSSTSKYAFRDESGAVAGIYAVGRDVTIEYEARMSYEREFGYIAELHEGAYASTILDVTEWRLEETHISGRAAPHGKAFASIDEFKDYAVNSVVEGETARDFFRTMTKESLRAVYDSGRRKLEIEYLRAMPDAAPRWMRNDVRFIADPATGHLMAFVSLHDIDEKKREEDKLARAAEEDSMTGLFNHDATLKHIGRYLQTDGRAGVHALMMIDIDNFKSVNDIFGHQTGDDVITDIAAAIKKTFRDTDIVGRIGGDEFMVLMKNAVGKRVIAKKARDLIDALQYDCHTGSGTLELSGSVGVSLYKGGGATLDKLYAEADAALYRAKSEGKNRYAFAESDDKDAEGLSPLDNEPSSAVHLRALLENLEGAVIVCDVDAGGEVKVVYTSPSAFKTFKRTKEQIGDAGRGIFSVALPEDAPGLISAIRTAAETDGQLDHTYRTASQGGGVEWRHARGSALPGSEGGRRVICVITDITEIKEREEQLRFAELRARTALGQSPAMLWEVDLRTREMKFSGFGADEIGYSGRVFKDVPESLLAEGHIRDDYKDEFRRMFADIYAGRDGGEYYLMSKDAGGEYVPVRASFRLLRDEGGAPYYVIGVREPRIVSQELSLYRTMTYGGVFSIDVDDDFTLLYGNDRYYAIHGYTRESMAALLDNKCRRFIHPRDRELAHEAVSGVITSGGSETSFIMRIITSGGDTRYIRVSGEFEKRENGHTVMNGVVMDVTEQKLTELTLRQKALELDSIIQSTPGGIFSYSAEEDEQFTFVSENMLKMLGYTRDEFIRKFDNRFSPMVWHEDRERVLAEINEQIEGSDFDKCEYRIETGNGELKWVHDVGHLVVDGDGWRWFYVVIVDITAQKVAEEELRRQRQALTDRYRRIMEMRDGSDKDAIGSFSFNLTRNTCGDGHAASESIRSLQESGTVDGFFENAYARNTDPDQRKEFRAIFNRAALLRAHERGETSLSFEHKFMIEPGRPSWIRTNIVMVKNPETRDVEGYTCAKNIEAEKTTRMLVDKFIDIEYEFAALIDVKNETFSVVKRREGAAFLPPLGLSDYSDVIMNRLMKCVPAGAQEQALDFLSLERITEELEKRGAYKCYISLRAEDGHMERKRWSYTYLDSSRSVIACMRRDVTDVYASETDAVTGIYNYSGFRRAVRRMIADNPEIDFCMIRMDLDHFKVYNDLYGIRAGDELLAAIGAVGRSHSAPLRVYGHLQGDHFIACVPVKGLDVRRSIDDVAKKLRAIQPDFSFVVRCGIYNIDDSGLDVGIMGDRALMALRSTKGRYDADFAYYDESMRAEVFEKQELASAMKQALSGGEFRVYLQPQYDQASGKIVGAEALARWFHKGEILSPAKFIEVFEQNGFIMQLDEYIWEQVCALMRRWLDEGRPVAPISVNISRIDIYNPKLRKILNGLVEKYRLSTEMLRLEITETAYTQNPGQLIGVVKRLREDGFFVEMDDFGSGYSSLNMLKDVVVDMIKLDMRFLSASAGDGRSGMILNAMVRMAHWLNVPVIAEGVETPRQADFLKTIGCSLAQGYLYAKPMPAAEFEECLSAGGTTPLNAEARVASFFNNSEFWDAESQATVVFNSFVGAACIVEYKEGCGEILRANDRFFEETGLTGDEFRLARLDVMKFMRPEDRALMAGAIDDAAKTDREAYCETRWERRAKQSGILWFGIRMRVIAHAVDRCIIYAMIENVTRRKEMEAVLRAENEKNRLLIDFMDAMVFDYDYDTDTMIYKLRRHDSGFTTVRRERYLAGLAERKIIRQDCVEPMRALYAEAAKAPVRGIFDYAADDKGSGWHWNRAHYVSMANEEGRVCRMVGVVNNIEDKSGSGQEPDR